MSLTRIDSGSGTSLLEALEATTSATEPAMNSRLEIILPPLIRWRVDSNGYSRTRTARDAMSASHIACRSLQAPKPARLPRWVCDRRRRIPGRIARRQVQPNFRAPIRIPTESEEHHCRKDDGHSDKALLQPKFGRSLLRHRM